MVDQKDGHSSTLYCRSSVAEVNRKPIATHVREIVWKTKVVSTSKSSQRLHLLVESVIVESRSTKWNLGGSSVTGLSQGGSSNEAVPGLRLHSPIYNGYTL
jgi:hypothetical protein